VSIALGFASLTLPWWTFIIFARGTLSMEFHLFLWGVLRSGLPTSFPIDWWSYIALALVVLSIGFSLLGYLSLGSGRSNGKKLVAISGISAIGGYVFFFINLLFEFSTLDSYVHGNWTTYPLFRDHPISAFNIRVSHYYDLVISIFEFLSVGFWMALVSSVCLWIVLYRLHRNRKSNLTKPTSQG
jgi:hypothetical protein